MITLGFSVLENGSINREVEHQTKNIHYYYEYFFVSIFRAYVFYRIDMKCFFTSKSITDSGDLQILKLVKLLQNKDSGILVYIAFLQRKEKEIRQENAS
jgi:hypothetical protein